MFTKPSDLGLTLLDGQFCNLLIHFSNAEKKYRFKRIHGRTID